MPDQPPPLIRDQRSGAEIRTELELLRGADYQYPGKIAADNRMTYLENELAARDREGDI
jgi:hypothetical protein